MRNDFSSSYLAHHGILGQKWGHKNGGEIDLAYDHYINLQEDLDQTTEELKKLKKEYNE